MSPYLSMDRKSLHGMSLLEMSIVIVIVAVISTMGMVAGSSMLESTRQAQTETKLNTVEEALAAYRIGYERLPCPADATLATTNANYGVEAANAGSCIGGTPAANRSVDVSGVAGGVVEGAVPVKTLGLPEEFMYDGWGRKFTYAVWDEVTEDNGFVTYGIAGNCGAITIKDAGNADRTTAAVYALISSGPNGHGGYLRRGTRMDADSINTDELTNCHCNANAANTTYAATYVQKNLIENPSNPLDVFDDIVRFKERMQLKSPDDWYSSASVDCNNSPGFRVDGTLSNVLVGWDTNAGDINGDGLEDLIIGGPGESGAIGKVYIIWGRNDRNFANPLKLDELDGTNGVMITDSPWDTSIGYDTGVGDVDDDGIDDLLIGNGDGSIYILFGKTGAWTSPISVGTPDGTNYVELYSGSHGSYGTAIASADVNNDGIDDIITTAPCSASDKGHVYVMFGHADPWAATIDPTAAAVVNGTSGFYYIGQTAVAGCWALGASNISTGDINDDNIADIVVGDGAAYNSAVDRAYVIFGHANPWVTPANLSALNGTDGFAIRKTGVDNAGFGQPIFAKDVNGDDYADLVVGCYECDVTHNGSIYVYWGKAGAWAATYDADPMVTGGMGIRIDGSGNRDLLIPWGVEDINGDGINDILAAAPGDSFASSPQNAFIIFGHSGAWSNWDLETTAPNGTNGVWFNCPELGEYSCGVDIYAVDIDNDGIKDVAVSEQNADSDGQNHSGWSWIVYGKTTWTSPYDLTNITTAP